MSASHGACPMFARSRRKPVRRLVTGVLAGLLALCASADAEVLVRWTLDDIPPASALGLRSIAIAAADRAAIGRAVAQGFRVYVQIEGPAASTFRLPHPGVAGVLVKGEVSPPQLSSLERRVRGTGARLLLAREHPRGKWPHIRTNWVTRDKDILQVTSRSAQPWIENNAAVFAMMRASTQEQETGAGLAAAVAPLLSYAWAPVTIAAMDRTPRLEHYLVAIAEAGSFGGSVVLPLHEEFQRELLLGKPRARNDWEQIRQHLEFYAWDLPARYRAVANIAVVTASPLAQFDALNLLLRHNLPFELVAPAALGAADLQGMDLLILMDPWPAEVSDAAMQFAREGGIVLAATGSSSSTATPWRDADRIEGADDRQSYAVGTGRVVELLQPIANPDRFAFEVRQLLGAERRVIDVWNGITVLARPYRDPAGDSMLVTAVNYAVQPLPVQLRVKGTYSLVHVESPGGPLELLPHTHRDGYTEFVIPSLTLGARVFLSDRHTR